MALLSSDVIIDAPAGSVWEAIAHRFDQIGTWAAAIPASAAVTLSAGSAATGAPVPARVCHTGIRALPKVVETIVSYDEAAKALTYQASGLPSFITLARNTWTVTELGPNQARVDMQAQFQTRGGLGRVLGAAILWRVSRDGRHLLEDLKHHVEKGYPSPRKSSLSARGPGRGKTDVDDRGGWTG